MLTAIPNESSPREIRQRVVTDGEVAIAGSHGIGTIAKPNRAMFPIWREW
jgi:hypothetical protein